MQPKLEAQPLNTQIMPPHQKLQTLRHQKQLRLPVPQQLQVVLLLPEIKVPLHHMRRLPLQPPPLLLQLLML